MGFDGLRRADKWMSIASAVLLASYLALALYALGSPSSDPQRGMADGFAVLVALVILSVGGLLWFAAARNHPWLVRAIFVLTAFPAVSQAAQELFLLLTRSNAAPG